MSSVESNRLSGSQPRLTSCVTSLLMNPSDPLSFTCKPGRVSCAPEGSYKDKGVGGDLEQRWVPRRWLAWAGG